VVAFQDTQRCCRTGTGGRGLKLITVRSPTPLTRPPLPPLHDRPPLLSVLDRLQFCAQARQSPFPVTPATPPRQAPHRGGSGRRWQRSWGDQHGTTFPLLRPHPFCRPRLLVLRLQPGITSQAGAKGGVAPLPAGLWAGENIGAHRAVLRPATGG